MKIFSKVLFAVTSAASLLVAPAAFATVSDAAATTVSAKGATVEALNAEGASSAAIGGGTELTLKGSDFQAIKGGAGGVYVMFGWVSEPEGMGWSPTNGGTTGATYRYAPDAEDEENAGYTRYIAFEGSKTASAANGGFVNADGTWETTLMVPTATFESVDREGEPMTVDCLKDICGVITIGAHGTKNGNNETFTPVTFVEDIAAGVIDDESDNLSDSSSEPAPSESTEAGASEGAGTETSAPAPAESSQSGDSNESEVAADQESGMSPVLWIIGGAAVLIVAVVAVLKKSNRTTYND